MIIVIEIIVIVTIVIVFEDYINHYIYLFLLGGTLVLNELHFDSGEQRQLNELLFKGSSEFTCSKNCGLGGILNKCNTYH